MARTIADALNELVNGEPNGLKPQINKKAPIDSPALTGTPTAPTPAEGDNSTKLATTEFVQNVVNKLLSFADSDLDTFSEVIDEIKAMRSAQASSTDFGMVKVGSNINVVDGTISLTKNNVVNALGYTPPTTAGSATLYSSTGSATDGAMTQAATTAALANKLDATASAASAATASKVTGGTIQLTGSVTGSGSFNSAGNVTINTSGGGTTYSTGTASTAGITKLYTSTGSSTDGAMTQAATTAALAKKLDTTASAASAATASKVTGGTIQLTGSVTGSGSFNSAGNVTINTSGGGTTYSTGTASTAGITKLYTSTGTSTDGTMTRQAITNELNQKLTATNNVLPNSFFQGANNFTDGVVYDFSSTNGLLIYSKKPITIQSANGMNLKIDSTGVYANNTKIG